MKSAIPSIRKDNNFDLLRLFAAMLVIFIHAFYVSGQKDPVLLFTTQMSGGELAVYIFFVISGYLITKSWLTKPDLTGYFKKRFLRIYPALIAVIIFSIFFAGPLLTQHSLQNYFSDLKTYSYLTNLTLWRMQYALPGVTYNNIPLIINIPLWTLFFEFSMYILVPFFGLLGLFKGKYKAILILIYVLLLIFHIAGVPDGLFIIGKSAKFFVAFFLYFFSGAFYYLYAEKKQANIFLVASLIILTLFCRENLFFNLLSVASISGLVFWFSFLKIHPLKSITSKGDFSYGLYLYGYVIQNIIIHFSGKDFSPLVLFVVVLAGTIPFAVLSWRFIESKALQFK